ncbi:MAG: M28 family peptidase [Saprospiraceae bacterium]|nr:M28 family peptidase [Candidatus Brachybacter algidus]
MSSGLINNKPLLDRVIRKNNSRTVNYKLDYTYNDLNHPLRLYYRSDHYNFAELGIPSVFFFGGFHKDYHKSTDAYIPRSILQK